MGAVHFCPHGDPEFPWVFRGMYRRYGLRKVTLMSGSLVGAVPGEMWTRCGSLTEGGGTRASVLG